MDFSPEPTSSRLDGRSRSRFLETDSRKTDSRETDSWLEQKDREDQHTSRNLGNRGVGECGEGCLARLVLCILFMLFQLSNIMDS